MFNTKTLFFFILLMLVGVLPIFGGVASSCVGGNEVFFINGIWVPDESDARDEALILSAKLRTQISGTPAENQCTAVSYAYNTSHGVEDLLQASDQIFLGNYSQLWRILGRLVPSTPEYEQIFDQINGEIIKLDDLVSEDLDNHLTKYRESAQERGNRIILIGHSQGNLYANRAYARLTTEPPIFTNNNLRVIAVATPDSYVAGSGPYTTLVEDFVANVVFLAVNPLRLWPNTQNNLFPISHWDAHSFIESYLNGSVSKPRILNDIIANIAVLPPSSPQLTISTPTCSQGTSCSGSQGTTFTIQGAGFSPNQSISRFSVDSSGTQTPVTPALTADANGQISWFVESSCSTSVGSSSFYAIDHKTGTQSNSITQTITAGNCYGTVATQATLGGVPWSGTMSYDLVGPQGTIAGLGTPSTTGSSPIGQYQIVYKSGGPASSVLTGIIPSSTQTLLAGQAITFTFIFSPPVVVNQPPTAGFTMTSGSQSAIEGQSLALTVPVGGTANVAFSAARSSDPDGTVTAWEWKIDGKLVSTASSIMSTLGVGSSAITLVVTDNNGIKSNTAQGTVVVTEGDSAAWRQKHPVNIPLPQRTQHTMVYDAARAQIVLFGGRYAYGNNYFNDTWIWDGTNWIQKFPINSPPARSNHSMTYDVARAEVVLFGGWNGTSDLNDTWIWDGTNWTQIIPVTSPPPRSGKMAYDAARSQIVLFGGYPGNSGYLLGDTWVWDGTNWIQKFPTNNPSPRSNHTMAYDIARAQIVLFGGDDNRGLCSDTWIWDGTNWIKKFPVDSPSPRLYHAMAYDSAHEQMVLFGGLSGNSGLRYGDTWVWDGTNWIQKIATNSPSPRYDHTMAYDSAHEQIILFGGSDGGVPNDTWVWAEESASVATAFSFSGMVTFIDDLDGLLGNTVTIGAPVSGTFKYEMNAIDSAPNDPNFGSYFYHSGASNISVTISTQSGPKTVSTNFAGDGVAIEVENDMTRLGSGMPLHDTFRIYGYGSTSSWQLPVFDQVSIAIVLTDTQLPLEFIASEALPITLDFAQIQNTPYTLASISAFENSTGRGYRIGFQLTGLTKATVP
jgi:hypothetical protein